MYELLDSGDFEKLERWGEFVLRRPDPQAFWKKHLLEQRWLEADAIFDKKWHFKTKLPESWEVQCRGFVFKISLSSFKHTGLFPEHAENWSWISQKTRPGSNILNLFGYTGGATLAVLKGGADLSSVALAKLEVVHVDSSKLSIERAKENAKLNNLEKEKIRWIVDDASLFVKREVSRGNTYDGIILDPPAFGRGAKKEVWKIEEGLIPLLEQCKKILNKGGFLLLNGYAEGYTSDAYAQLLSSVFDISLEKIESGTLSITEASPRGFILPAGIYARIANV